MSTTNITDCPADLGPALFADRLRQACDLGTR
ncbi:hypothetical protein Aros01_02201 [Streptosporangium roseum]|uniref:Uncharacterized protein n=1 Tax=Streptosporangium roseum (strain ATCC 12428 / DSM 43021 / JCM 3005 / KCTC 9067 / NCIMB 10171 / NRRL 2505 / NI 9100) TaxID=479432 RepID=D2B7T0_STRRD|nr:hypothetical protein Sros_0847 [Streptosporangium roseum DSM 43021]